MKNTIQAIVEMPLHELQSEDAKSNWSDYSDNQCCLCGKKVGKNPKMIHYLTNGNIISTDEHHDKSQGFFPVGSECAKKLIVNFAF